MAFYVYQLVDPRNGLPFYVGKGQGRRAWQHQREVESGLCRGNARKISKIREILIAGFDVEVQIVADYELESDALDHEFRLVDRHPTLTNVMPGGGEGRTITPEQREKRRLARQARVEALRAKERGIKTAIAFERKRAALNALPYASLHADEINQWVDAERKAAETPVEEKPDEATDWALAKIKAQAVRDRIKRRRLAKRANLKRRRAEARAAEAASQTD